MISAEVGNQGLPEVNPSSICPYRRLRCLSTFREPVSVYFSESGAKGFDAALEQQKAAKTNGVPKDRDIPQVSFKLVGA
jgi:hypothetical protein